jgi:hypothetical protein
MWIAIIGGGMTLLLLILLTVPSSNNGARPRIDAAIARADVDAAVPTTAPVDADVPLDLDDASPLEQEQQRVSEWLNAMMNPTNKPNPDITFGVSEGDLMVVVWRGKCDRATLDATRKAIVKLKRDPAKLFATIQCNGGPVLRLR